jgi:hypothetical protein
VGTGLAVATRLGVGAGDAEADGTGDGFGVTVAPETGAEGLADGDVAADEHAVTSASTPKNTRARPRRTIG